MGFMPLWIVSDGAGRAEGLENSFLIFARAWQDRQLVWPAERSPESCMGWGVRLKLRITPRKMTRGMKRLNNFFLLMGIEDL